MAPLTTFHEISIQPLYVWLKVGGLHCAADAPTEYQSPYQSPGVPMAQEDDCSHSPVSTSMFQGREAVELITSYALKG